MLIIEANIFELYESNIDPMIRFIHIVKLEASGWIKIPKKKCD